MLKDLFKNPRALLLAILVHVALVLLLVVSLQWVQAPPSLQGSENIVQAVVIDESKTRTAERAQQEALKRQAEDEAKRKAAADEEQRQREAEEVKQQERQREEQLEVERALAEKQRIQEKRLAEQESKRKLEAEQQRKADAEAKRKIEEDARRKAETEAKRKAESEAKRKAEEEARREQEAKELLQQQLAQEEQQLLAGERDKRLASLREQYAALIKQKVQRNWIEPPNLALQGTASCRVRVVQIPGGEVVSVDASDCKGDAAYRRSVEAAVLKSSPLPPPPDPAVFDRNINIKFEPR